MQRSGIGSDDQSRVLDFALVVLHGVKLPPKGLQSAILVSMLFSEHPKEIFSVKPPRRVMTVLSGLGKMLGYRLPQ